LACWQARQSPKAVSPEASIDKWKLYRWLCEARVKLGISDRALSVLNALMSFYPKTELSGSDGLVVFPSNTQLSLRTHGMAETTLRRHLAALVDSGLLTRRDSPNGKRYVRRDQQGTIGEAFGFSLAPLLARAGEIEQLAAEVTAERLLLQRLRERVTLVRRDIAKLIEAALEDGLAGNWMRYEAEYRREVQALPRFADARKPDARHLPHSKPCAWKSSSAWNSILFYKNRMAMPAVLSGTNRIQNPNLHLTLNQASNRSRAAKVRLDRSVRPRGKWSRMKNRMPGIRNGPSTYRRRRKGSIHSRRTLRTRKNPIRWDLCCGPAPEIVAFGPGGAISSWRDLMTAAVVVRSMLAISPSAYEQACAVLGPENAATVIGCMLERSGHINSAGGYLRDLTRRAERGEFSAWPDADGVDADERGFRPSGQGDGRSLAQRNSPWKPHVNHAAPNHGGKIRKPESMPPHASVQQRHRSISVETGPVVPFPAERPHRPCAALRRRAWRLAWRGRTRLYWLKVLPGSWRTSCASSARTRTRRATPFSPSRTRSSRSSCACMMRMRADFR
jgi:replication initiation protein RepC